MTTKAFIKSASQHPYILARCKRDEQLVGLSTAIMKKVIGKQLFNFFSNKESPYSSFIPCTFNEFISHKFPCTYERYQYHLNKLNK